MSEPGKADQNTIRRHNAALVLNQLRRYGPMSRADLAKRIGLNRSTVSSIVAQLLDETLVVETELRMDKIGRPGLLLELNRQGGGMVGVEFGVDFIHVILTDFVANTLWRRRILIGEGEPQETYTHIAGEMIRQAMERAGQLPLPVMGIGLALPGMVDAERGELKYAPNLRWHDVPFGERWSSRFGLPVVVENNSNAGAVGEYYLGAARNVDHFIYIGGGTGIGGGIIMDGRIFRGRGGFAGEIGHMTIDPEGDVCSCGRRGCWETLVGPRAVAAKYRSRMEAGGAKVESARAGFPEIVEAARLGDLVAVATLQDAARYLGIGIANLVNIFNPQLVVLGGVLGQASEQFIPVIKETVKQNSLLLMRAGLSIVPSLNGADDCVLGAAALVLDRILREPV